MFVPSSDNSIIYIVGLCFYLVPIPTVNVTAPNPQTVGQSLTLQCEVTTVRGVVEVDTLWRNISDGMMLREMSFTTTSTMYCTQTLTLSHNHRRQK